MPVQVAVKVSGVVTEYETDEFIINGGTSPKLVYDDVGILVWSPHNMFVNSNTPATQNVTLVVGRVYTVTVTGTGSLAGSVGASGTATAGSPATFTATATTGTFTLTGSLTTIQLNRGAVATAYLATGASTRFGVALTYNPTTLAAEGMLCEPAATNLLIRSNEADQWFKTHTVVTANDISAPNGLLEADKISDDGLGGVSTTAGIEKSVSIAATTVYTLSAYLKAGSESIIDFRTLNDDVNKKGTFNLATQVFTPGAGSPTGTFEQLPNSWWRIAMTWTSTSDTTISLRICFPSITRDGTHNIYIWGIQFELGPVATSLIPTYAAVATRAADNYTFLLNTIPALGSAYSIYERFQVPIVNNAKYAVALTDGSVNEISGIKSDAGATLSVVDGGAAQAAITIGTMSVNTPVSAAMSVQANDVGGSVDGSAVTSDVTATLPTLDQVRFGGAGDNNAAAAAFKVAKLVIVPRAWSDAELTLRSAA